MPQTDPRKRRRKRRRRSRPDFTELRQQVLRTAPPGGASAPEASVRSRLLASFLNCPHGKTDALAPLHLEAVERDPILYGHLARWYFDHGAVRDHQELFVAHLLVSPYPEHREHGHVLMQRLRVYQAARVVRYLKDGLRCNLRSLRAAVTAYLRRREAHPGWLDECVIRDRHHLKYLYATLHVKPCPRAEDLLFAERIPTDSRVHAARLLPRLAETPDRQAELIVRHHIHYTTALGAIRHFTPAVVHALASVMTGPQVITSLKFLERRGALAHPPTRALIDEKLRKAVGEGRVSELKARVALGQLQPDAKLAEDLLRMTHERLRTRGRIDRPTALLVDKSGSMEQAIEVGKLLAALCSALADHVLHVTAFDSHAFPVRAARPTFAAWERAFAPLRADGATSVGAGLRPLLAHPVEQIVIITDGVENQAPYFHEVLAEYERRHAISCRIVIVKLGADAESSLETSLRGREVNVIPFDGDYYSLPNVIPLLCSGTRFEMLEDVLSVPLFTRKDVATLPPGFDERTFEVL